jgi:tetratricopeptide (TPR) repeat protein
MKSGWITGVVWVVFVGLTAKGLAAPILPPEPWEQLLAEAKKAYLQGDLVKTQRLLQEALSEAERLGPEDPSVAVCLYNLARVQADSGHYEVAEPLLQRTVAILAKVWGADNPRVAVAQVSLADVRVAQKRLADAEPLYQSAVAALEKSLGREHTMVGLALERYAVLLRKASRPGEAEPLEARARDIRVKPPQPPRVP